eukprot:6212145-Pleurochrysis_carterae.AAC.2
MAHNNKSRASRPPAPAARSFDFLGRGCCMLTILSTVAWAGVEAPAAPAAGVCSAAGSLKEPIAAAAGRPAGFTCGLEEGA